MGRARASARARARVLDIWRKYASNIVDTDAMPCGHYMQEEMPDQVYAHFIKFFTA